MRYVHPKRVLETTVTAASNATNKILKRERKCNINIASNSTKVSCSMCSKKVKDLEGHINRQHQSNWTRNQQTSEYNLITENKQTNTKLEIKEFGESSKGIKLDTQQKSNTINAVKKKNNNSLVKNTSRIKQCNEEN